MASAGLELLRIQLLGRWGGDAFLLYLRGAPLAKMEGLAREAQAGLQVADLQAQLAELHVQALDLRKKGLEFARNSETRPERPWHVDEPAAILDGTTATALFAGKPVGSQFILNKMPHGRVHLVESADRAFCGWAYNKGSTEAIARIRGLPLCPSCFDLDPPGADSESSGSD